MDSLTRPSACKMILTRKYCKDGHVHDVLPPLQSRILTFSNCPRRLVFGVNFTSLINCQSILPISSATSSDLIRISKHIRKYSEFIMQATEETVDGEVDQLSTARVRFQLRKACGFGEHFVMVGDDPLFGSWDPENAIKMEWSDGHIWTAQVDIPVEKAFQFKFVLKQSTGEIIWQPGPDRIFKTRATNKTITVVEDWENSELQKILEDGVPGQDEGLLLKTDVKSENITVSEDLTSIKTNIVPTAAEERSYPAKESSIRNMVAYKIISDHRSEGLEEGDVILAEPVLVPGLAPSISNLSTDGSPLDSNHKNIDLNDSIKLQDFNGETALEACSNLQDESEAVILQLQQETQPNLFSQQEMLKSEREEPDTSLTKKFLKVGSEEEQKADVKPDRKENSEIKFKDEIEFNNPNSEEVESRKDTAVQDSYRALKKDLHWSQKTLQNLLATFWFF